jgi:ABC-type Zn uptake system ZnuABC Zn-binding protein ZnuA
MRSSLPVVVAAVASATALALAGCGEGARAGGPLTIDASVAPIRDIVARVAGRASVVQLVPDGVDSHTFEPSPRTAKELRQADVVFLNGLHLEDPTLRLARADHKAGAVIVELGDRTIGPPEFQFDFTFPRSKGDPNPHLWMDPVYARRYSEIVADELGKRLPAQRPTFEANQARLADVLGRLDTAVAAAVATIPPEHRKLLTYHDSFAYFAKRYGLSVIGAVQPADFSEPTPREVDGLVDQVRRERVPAVFGSEAFPSTVLARVADETGARYVAKLRDDQLPGRPGERRHSYVGLMVDDVTTMVSALGGDPAPLRTVPL